MAKKIPPKSIIPEEVEEQEETTEPLTLVDLLDAYQEIISTNGQKAGKPVSMGEVYTYLSEQKSMYGDPGDFADALSALIDSAPENSTRGYSCNIEMKDDEYRSLSFMPLNIDLEPPKAPRGHKPAEQKKPDEPAPAASEAAPKAPELPPYAEALSELKIQLQIHYDDALRLQRGTDHAFFQAQEKAAVGSARFDAGKKVYILEKALRKALDENNGTEMFAVLEGLKLLREELGYRNS